MRSTLLRDHVGPGTSTEYTLIAYENVNFQTIFREGPIDHQTALAHLVPHSFQANRNPARRYLARLSPGSRRTQQVALDRIAAFMTDEGATAMAMPWHLLDERQTDAIRTRLSNYYAPPTTNRMLAALRGVLKEAWRLELMDAETYHRATAIQNVPWSTLPRGRTLDEGEIRALFAVCADDPTPAGVRDAALLTVLYGGGLRRSEVTALEVGDYDIVTGALTIRSTQVSRERVVYARDGAAEALSPWIATRGSEAGLLFVPINKGARILVQHERMSDQAIYRALVKRGEQAHVTAFSSGDLRRTFITRLLEAGADIATVQRLAGHSSPTTTQRYDRRSQTVQRELARMLDVPAAGR
jgi:integrase